MMFLIILVLFLIIAGFVLSAVIYSKRTHNPDNYQVVKAQFMKNNKICYVVEFKSISGKYNPILDQHGIKQFESYKDAAYFIDCEVYEDSYKKL